MCPPRNHRKTIPELLFEIVATDAHLRGELNRLATLSRTRHEAEMDWLDYVGR